jgi:uncharacterized protein YhaN
MLLKRIEIRNVRKIKQADIDFHGSGLQVIQGMNESGKTTLAQSIALSMEGSKAFTLGMITHGEEKAEIQAYFEGDREIKIRTVISDTVKQTVHQKDEFTGKYNALSGGVRAFIDSIHSGLEMPWAMKDMTDAKIIEMLKEKTGISKTIAEIDAIIKEQETVRTETGRDKKRIGELTVVPETAHPDPIDNIKAEREKAMAFLKFQKELFEFAKRAIREKEISIESIADLKALSAEIEGLAANNQRKTLIKKSIYASRY